MEECKNCCYFTISDDPSWVIKGKPVEHCCFREWGHGDWETAPCDEPTYEEPNDYYGDEEDYEDEA